MLPTKFRFIWPCGFRGEANQPFFFFYIYHLYIKCKIELIWVLLYTFGQFDIAFHVIHLIHQITPSRQLIGKGENFIHLHMRVFKSIHTASYFYVFYILILRRIVL